MVDFRHRIELELNNLEKEAFPEENKKLIKQFINDLKINGISEARVSAYLPKLRKIAEWIPDKFTNPSKEDIKKVMEIISNNNYQENTIITYVKMMKKFYKWLLGNNETSPECVSWLKRLSSAQQKHRPDDMITKTELSKLIDRTNNARDRALISLLYDSGARVGEIVKIKIKDLTFDNYGMLLKVYGKTGYREIRVVGDSIAYLRTWLDNHPKRNDTDSWLFCEFKDPDSSITHEDIYSMLKKVSKRAGIKRRIYPHLFRHTRATILASKITEAPLEAQMGWVHGSNMTRTYVHLSRRDQDNAVLKAYGIKVNEEDIVKEDMPIKCARCGELNPSNAKYCRRCWLPLNVETALEMEQKEKEIQDTLLKTSVMDPFTKSIIDKIPEEAKIQLLNTIIDAIIKNPEMRVKVFQDLTK